PYPIPDGPKIENASDGHLIVVDFPNARLYEVANATKSGNGWSGYAGAIFDLSSNQLRPAGWTSADAAGLPIYPGLVRYDEVTAGALHHARPFTALRPQKGSARPARPSPGWCPVGSDCPPMGLRVRLKASVDISPYPPSVRVILAALKTYGMFLADNG